MQFNQYNPIAPGSPLPFTPHANAQECGEALMASKYKTSLCRTWQETGYCTYEHRCMFAHGPEDLRTKEGNMADGLTSDTAIRNYQRRLTEEAQRSVAPLHIPITGSSCPSSPMTSASYGSMSNCSPANSMPVTPAQFACPADHGCPILQPIGVEAGTSAFPQPPMPSADAPRPFRFLQGSAQQPSLTPSTTSDSLPSNLQWASYKEQEDSLVPSHGSNSSTTGPTERSSSRGSDTDGSSSLPLVNAATAIQPGSAAPSPTAADRTKAKKGKGPRHMTPQEQAQGYHSNSPYTAWEYNPNCKCRDCVAEWCARF